MGIKSESGTGVVELSLSGILRGSLFKESFDFKGRGVRIAWCPCAVTCPRRELDIKRVNGTGFVEISLSGILVQ